MEGPWIDHFTDFYEAWEFLREHPDFSTDEIKVGLVKKGDGTYLELRCRKLLLQQEVDAETQKVMKELRLDKTPLYDLELYSCALTFEEAIVKLANLVCRKYGDRKQAKAEAWEEAT